MADFAEKEKGFCKKIFRLKKYTMRRGISSESLKKNAENIGFLTNSQAIRKNFVKV